MHVTLNLARGAWGALVANRQRPPRWRSRRGRKAPTPQLPPADVTRRRFSLDLKSAITRRAGLPPSRNASAAAGPFGPQGLHDEPPAVHFYSLGR